MKISFVIPAYNEAAWLGTCLKSVQKELARQSCQDAEIIVVNNASTDTTKSIAKTFKNVIVVDEPKKGLTYARQAGFQAAHGDLIANVDADTELPAEWLKKVFDEFTKNERLVALSGPHMMRDLPLGARINVRFFYYLGYISYLVNHFILKKGGMLQGGNYILKRTALEKIGGFDTGITFYGEDADVARRMQEQGEVKFTFSLPIYASSRRLKAEGLLTMGLRYGINYFSIMIFKKPFTKEYRDIR